MRKEVTVLSEELSSSDETYDLSMATSPRADLRLNSVYLVATASISYLVHGFQNSITNGMILLTPFLAQFPEMDTTNPSSSKTRRNATVQGIVVASYTLGCAMGSIMCYTVTGKFGRKRSAQVLGFLTFVGGVLQLTAFKLPHLICGRIILGMSVGMGHSTFPLYIGETVDASIRGGATIACGAAANFGHVIGAAIEIAVTYGPLNSFQWRLPFGIQVVACIALMIMPFWLVETPRWLLMNGDYQGALKSIASLSGKSVDDPEVIRACYSLYSTSKASHPCEEDDIPFEKSSKAKPAKPIWRTTLAVLIQVMASMSGIDIISYYSTTIFQSELHFKALTSRCLTLALQVCQFFSSTLGVMLIDRVGRRPLLLACGGLMAINMGFMGGLTGPHATLYMLKASVLFQFLDMAIYPLGFHLTPWIVAAEISPCKYRHKITALAGFLHWMFNFMVSLITPIAMTSIGADYFFVYLATNIATVVMVYFLYPETKNLSLEEIETIFESSHDLLEELSIGIQSQKLLKSGAQNENYS